MQTTYLKQTATTILKTARIAPSMAGEYCVWVNVPKMGECQARLQTRQTGWGDLTADILQFENGHGDRLTLTTTSRSLALIVSLVAECEAKQLAALRAEGHLI